MTRFGASRAQASCSCRRIAGQPQRDCRPAGRASRRLEPDVLHLRSQPRRRPRVRSAVVRRVPASVARSVLPPGARRSRLLLPRLDQHPGSARWKQQFRIWMDAVEGIRRQRRLDHDRRRCGIHLFDLWLRPFTRVRATRGGPQSARQLEAPQSYGTDVLMMNGRLVSNYTPVAAGDRAEVVHGADIEVDHQGRLSLSRAYIDARSQGHGRPGTRTREDDGAVGSRS